MHTADATSCSPPPSLRLHADTDKKAAARVDLRCLHHAGDNGSLGRGSRPVNERCRCHAGDNRGLGLRHAGDNRGLGIWLSCTAHCCATLVRGFGGAVPRRLQSATVRRRRAATRLAVRRATRALLWFHTLSSMQ